MAASPAVARVTSPPSTLVSDLLARGDTRRIRSPQAYFGALIGQTLRRVGRHQGRD